jgi:hypothetical protein
VREKPVQNAILRWFSTQRAVRVWRQNTGVASYGAGPHRRTVAYGVPGAADITGILPDGRRLEVEVKSPTGTQSDAQRAFGAMITKHQGVYILARSVDDVIEGLREAGYGFQD